MSTSFKKLLFSWLIFLLSNMLFTTVASAQVNPDSVYQAFQNVRSQQQLSSFVALIENTQDVLGLAEKMGVGRYSDMVEGARAYSEGVGNVSTERLCRLYRHLVPTKYTKLEQIEELRKLSFHPEIQGSSHYLSLLQNLRFIYGDLELFDQFLTMIDEIEKHNDGRYSEHDLEYMRLVDRSSMFYRTKNFRKAMAEFQELAGFIADKESLEESSRLNNVALCYQNMGKPNSALIYFKQALGTVTKTMTIALERSLPVDSSFYFVVRCNIADIDVDQGRLDGAEYVFRKQLNYSDNYNSAHLVLSSFLSLAKLDYRRNRFNEALAYIDSIEANYQKSGFVHYYIKGLSLKTKIYLEQGNRQEALNAERESDYLQDSIRSVKADLNYQAAAIQLDINEAREAVLQASRGMEKAEQRSKYLGYGLFLALFVLGLGAWGLYVFRRKNKLLSDQKNTIDAALKEREVLLREIHHRVKNNLNIVSSLIQIQGRRIKDEEVKNVFKDAQNYVLSMSKVHQHLYEHEDLKQIGMSLYLSSLLDELLGSNWAETVTYHVEADSVNLSLDEALVLGILTTELVTNSLKHAFPTGGGSVKVAVERNGNMCLYRYADSGGGFDPNKGQLSSGFGLKLIRMSAEQLRGELNLSTEGEFSVEISFKAK